MNTYYSVFLFIYAFLGINYYNAAISPNTQCKNGFLAQMSNHLECRCNEKFTHVSNNTCKSKVECSKDTVDKACGEFAKCTMHEVGKEQTYTCDCAKSYILKDDVCVPETCQNIDCGYGKCIINEDSVNDPPICSCNIGYVVNIDDGNKCTKEGDTPCSLVCGEEHQICKKVDDYYRCNCEDGFKLSIEENKCISHSIYSMFNLSIIFVILLIFSNII
ncbi:25 kDa ookinete surface antigen precursor [Plasmodium berghei]|uniref:Ookinete surface protein P25 n=2 Tax=Plasmodium berghei TaxID=5821 RepID=A0A509AH53_PLABA|nr:ookinete surface protein P25 [Plasmodium berghei ANKA]SCL93081.1 25 kDa ookinete surface antigen precursor [Plasmodium berghei]SCM15785.1 25 kDa ookinete surface antigen precursor [Plasmodium berghei]SCM17580.1 25 kDa ookinete surface antigen precursor [Plasmodium berghei]SCN23055.1 25 kDa ookinete surface antigen precursor [Plasmodium berghei]VUC54562.1 ookinete surface protein P25 [Plasmodium berghei ANKA]|eukprot:XP_034420391.1 ookinete surface protein P25 [Plasmodium berghei ANKA]